MNNAGAEEPGGLNLGGGESEATDVQKEVENGQIDYQKQQQEQSGQAWGNEYDNWNGTR